MSELPSTESARIIAEAIDDARDGVLEVERLEFVRELLLRDPAARRWYLELNRIQDELASAVAEAESAPSEPRKPQRESAGRPSAASVAESAGRKRWAIGLSLAVGVAVLVLALIFRPGGERLPDPGTPIAVLTRIEGDVTITDAAAMTRSAAAGATLRSGDIVRTTGSLGAAVLAWPDGTRLSPVGNTSLTVSGADRKRIILHGGTLFAEVTPQEDRGAMVVATPQDEVLVLGTRFALVASTYQTSLRVSEGSVRLTRLKDGRTVDVPAGRAVVSNAASDLKLEAIPKTPETWDVDFESGLPEGWEGGRFVNAELPRGSRGGVKAVRDVSQADATFAIVSPSAWSQGLFSVHDDTHLHLALSMQEPGWFNILILTRTSKGDPPGFAGNFIFDEPVWTGRPGQWGTLTIPLSQFRSLQPGRDDFDDAVPFQLVLSSPDRDRGLIVDRIRITRGGPGKVRVNLLDPTPDGE